MAGRPYTQAFADKVWATVPWVCVLCHKPIESKEDGSVEHIIPRSKGGAANDLNNAALSHRRCNFARGNRSIEEFRASESDDLVWLFMLED